MDAPTTTDANLAAYLVFLGHTLDYSTRPGMSISVQVVFRFPDLDAERFQGLARDFLNSDFQRFCDAQRRVRSVIRAESR